jgi:2-polyprenyl-3-methyl-5-hydroxy-6-metoxy-1,4-benzoquinol methylase
MPDIGGLVGQAEYFERADKMNWFHAIDCGDFQTSGRFDPGAPQNQTLFGVMDLLQGFNLEGRKCLDVGTSDGLIAFGLAKTGAEVIAMDSFDLPSFRLLREILGESVEYRPNIQLKDLNSDENFDLAVCAGVIYHMLNPMSAFTILRGCVREGGFIIMESAYARGRRAELVLNSEAELVPEMSTYWLPTQSCMLGMMRLAGFNPVAVRTIHRPNRTAVLAQAVGPEEIEDRTDLNRRMHEVGFKDLSYSLSQSGERSSLGFDGSRSNEVLSVKRYVPSFPYHAHQPSNPAGKTRWTTAKGNK